MTVLVDLVIFVALAAAVGAVGVTLGIIVAPHIGRSADRVERSEPEQEEASRDDEPL